MKVMFLVDGFNLYHSILKLKEVTGYSAKWLDLHRLCKSYLHLFGRDARLEKVYYFSAIPSYLDSHNPEKVQRHRLYIDCLEHTGVKVVLGRFKSKDVYCYRCKSMILKHEEKETDVAVAVKLFEVFFRDECDIAVIVSGDTDLVPAIKTCTSLFANKRIVFAFPFARKSKEILSLAPGSFVISKNQYAKHLLPNPVKTVGGDIFKPERW
jgi:uncharacterized LabA/DUF88 family protein